MRSARAVRIIVFVAAPILLGLFGLLGASYYTSTQVDCEEVFAWERAGFSNSVKGMNNAVGWLNAPPPVEVSGCLD